MVDMVKAPDHTSMQGRVIDLSITGIGLEVHNKDAQKLKYSDRLVLSFQLPGCTELFNITGVVSYKKPLEGNVRCGIKFDWSRTENFVYQEMSISRYIINHQQLMLKKRLMGTEE